MARVFGVPEPIRVEVGEIEFSIILPYGTKKRILDKGVRNVASGDGETTMDVSFGIVADLVIHEGRVTWTGVEDASGSPVPFSIKAAEENLTPGELLQLGSGVIGAMFEGVEAKNAD